MKMKTRKGFTLIEMLIVIGIIVVLMAASIAGYSTITGQAEETKVHELVSNVATAMTALYQKEGVWPKRIVEGASGENLLDENAALPLAKKGYFSLQLSEDGKSLAGYDKFGILAPKGVTLLKQRGNKTTKDDVKKFMLCYAIDEDGDGITVHPNGDRVRATVLVWCASPRQKAGTKNVKMIESWTKGQVVR